MTARFSWTCPKCGLELVSRTSFGDMTAEDCPSCQRRALVDHVAAGGVTRFQVNLSRDERAYVEGRIKP
jgi:hypothetical protein